MSGPILLHMPTPGKVSHRELERVLVRQGEAIQRLAQATATDFETYGQLNRQTRELLADVMVQVEALKVQIAGILAVLDQKANT